MPPAHPIHTHGTVADDPASQEMEQTATPGPGPTPRPPRPESVEPTDEAAQKTETEAEKLIGGLTTGNQSQVSPLQLLVSYADNQALDQLYSYMKEHPEKEGEVNTVIGTLAPVVQAYVRRMLDSRKNADNPCKPLPSHTTLTRANMKHHV
jgi:hypothetical protein